MAKDMTRGNLVSTLLSFSLPLILSGLLQQLYSWADAFIVGNIEGEAALAAVGATVAVSNLFVMVIIGFTTGLSILAAKQYGSGREEDLTKILSSFILILGGIFLLLGSLGFLFADSFLQLLRTPGDIFETSKGYLQIILMGIPFLTIYNIYSAVLRGMGDSRAPFLSVLISSITNVVLDILFVGVFRWGAQGAAVATIISQMLMTVFTIGYTIKKYPLLRFRFHRGMIDTYIFRQGLRLGFPPAIQFSVSSFGNLFLQNFMNSFGTQTVAAITSAYRVDSIIMLPIVNLGSGISTMVAQNVGAGNQSRARKAFYAGTGMMCIFSVILSIVAITLGGNLVALFGVTEDAVSIGRNFFRAISVFYIFFGLTISFRGYLEGVGDVFFSSISGILSLGVRVMASYALASRFANMSIAYAEAVSWIALLLLLGSRYLWKMKKRLSE